MSKALVLFSGGQDSTTCLALAKSTFQVVEAVCFDYGQRHQVELQQAKKLADLTQTPLQIIPLPVLSQLTDNALTCHDRPIEWSSTLPNTFVPGRNHLFLSIVAILAYQKNIQTIYTGVCQTDYSGYPDCRQSFVTALNQALNLAMDTTFVIETPLMNLTKSETIILMQKLGHLDWYKETHTCYEGKRPACGQCPACQLRLKGFEMANIQDPLCYQQEKVCQ